MPAVYPSSIAISTFTGTDYEDISSYQIGVISANWGIDSNGPIAFLARTGTLRFSLRNEDGVFTPGHINAFSSYWKKGAKVKLEVSYDGKTRTWFGAIGDFIFEPDDLNNGPSITVIVVDWMDKAAKYPLNYPDILLEQTSDEAVQAILDAMPIQPLEQDFAVGTQSFPVVFDTVTDFTKARMEFEKILLSELCYMYVRHGGSLGEKLVLENADTRAGATMKTVPVASDDSGFLLMETGDFLLLETGDKIILDEAQDFDFPEDMYSPETSYGDNVINSIQFRYIPRRYSEEDPQWVYSSDMQVSPIDHTNGGVMNLILEPGETKVIDSVYQILGNDQGSIGSAMVSLFRDIGNLSVRKIKQPFPTDIDVNSMMYDTPVYPDFTMAAAVVVNYLVCRMDRFSLSITNNQAWRAYLELYIKMSTGSALIVNEPDILTDPIQDATSIEDNDYQPLQWDMLYQISGTAGTTFANNVLIAEAQPRTVLNRVNYHANRSSNAMSAFMNVDIGDLFPVVDANRGIDNTYFVQDMRFDIFPGGIVDFSLGVKENNMPVSLGSVVTGTSSGGTSVTLSYPVAAGLTLLVVQVTLRGSESISSVVRTHPTGGTNETFTLKSSKAFGSGSGDPRVELWYFLSPTPGTSNIVVTSSGASFIQAAAMQFFNVDQSAPFGAVVDASGTGGTPSVTVAGEIGDLALDLIGVATGTITPDSSQTSQWNASSDASWRGGGSTEAGAASVPMSWTLGGSNKWALLGVAIKRA